MGFAAGQTVQINCLGSVGALRSLEPLQCTPIGARAVVEFAPDVLPRIDAPLQEFGRSMGSRTKGLGEQ